MVGETHLGWDNAYQGVGAEWEWPHRLRHLNTWDLVCETVKAPDLCPELVLHGQNLMGL